MSFFYEKENEMKVKETKSLVSSLKGAIHGFVIPLILAVSGHLAFGILYIVITY